MHIWSDSLVLCTRNTSIFQYLEFSDDEQERSAKSKNRRKKKEDGDEGNVLPGARKPKQRRNRDR